MRMILIFLLLLSSMVFAMSDSESKAYDECLEHGSESIYEDQWGFHCAEPEPTPVPETKDSVNVDEEE